MTDAERSQIKASIATMVTQLQHDIDVLATNTKIDSPSFGECHICADTLDMKRLLWMPDTNTCIQYARELEK
ncbi:hypothetical protein [Chrysiogenes arsenatis]|uniref:hypothetical protein n=1 Tax=Chrysiogenes arsenatis TaxID=309797 RepID=UPI0003FFC37D|nr:hypothetical protein [Chrysiogenes arsenatis]